ncbi:MAG TPA: TIGR02444 family protein [Tianweitania sediminis]|jgi:uncharacterized protein (TIGR02444 family)|nr:TIGR02444 family protein [Tianweitania sediminis]
MSDPAAPLSLWEWTLGRYRREGVAPLCLLLQELYDADVNVLFLALWLAANGRALGPDDNPAAEVEAWHKSVVLPLRSARRAMKGWPMPEEGPTAEDRDAIRAKVQAAEIGTERLELGLLTSWAARVELRPADAGLDTALANLQQVLPKASGEPHIGKLAELTA